MRTKQIMNPDWLFKVKSLSPITLAEEISDHVKIVIIIVENDEVTPMKLSEEYYEKLKSLNKNANYILIPNEGHEILLNDKVMNEIKDLLK